MKTLGRILAICILMCLAACQDHSALLNKLNEAENWMDENPELAMSALKTIEPSELDREAHQARYALLYSQALDKNYIDSTNDSLISIAVDYYKDTEEVRPKFLSYYYLGRIYTNANELTKAMLAFMEAELLVDELGDDYAAGLLYHQMGVIYEEYYDFPKALESYRLSTEHFSKGNKPLHKLWGMLHQSGIYKNMNKDLDSFQLLQMILKEAKETNQTSIIRFCLGDLILLCLDMDKQDEALSYYNELEANHSMTRMTSALYGGLALMMAKEKDAEKSRLFMEEAWKRAKDSHDSINLYYQSAQIEYLFSSYQKAYSDLENSVSLQNSIVRKTLQQPVLSTQKDFLNQELELQKYKLQAERAKQAIGIGLAVILVTLLIYWIRKKQHQHLMQIEKEKDRLKENLEILQSTHEHTENLKNDLFESKMKELDKLVLVSLKEFKNEESRNRAILKLVQDIKGQFHGNKKSIAKLEKLVNEYQDNVMQHLRAEISLPDEAYYEMVCYLLANFSVNTIALLQEETTNTIYKRRERVRSLIQESSAPHKEQFLQI